MSLESANYISQLDASNPDGLTDYVSQGDDHLRLIKKTLTQSFPNINGSVSFSSTELNNLRTNFVFATSNFNANNNSIDNVASKDSNTAVEPRSYNDTRYVRQGNIAADSALFSNTKGINLQTTTLDTRNGISMNASNVINVGDSNQVLNLVGSDVTINGSTLINMFFPIGSIYENASNATNPGTLLGFGTWSALGAGRVLVAIDAGDTVSAAKFGSIGQTGGSVTHTLTEAEMPAHTHTIGSIRSGGSTSNLGGWNPNGTDRVSGSKGGSQPHENCQPYIVVYRWVRTA